MPVQLCKTIDGFAVSVDMSTDDDKHGWDCADLAPRFADDRLTVLLSMLRGADIRSRLMRRVGDVVVILPVDIKGWHVDDFVLRHQRPDMETGYPSRSPSFQIASVWYWLMRAAELNEMAPIV